MEGEDDSYQKNSEAKSTSKKDATHRSNHGSRSNHGADFIIEDNPYEREVINATTDCETFIHLLKGNIGTGILAMPEAFMNAGLWVGFVGIPLMGAICIHCMHILLKCSRVVSRRAKTGFMSYEETVEMAFKFGPEPVRKYSNACRIIITTFLIITQVGFCCVYFVFVQQNLRQAIECITPNGTGLSPLEYMAILIVPFLVITYIPDLKYLAPVSMVAAGIQSMGLIICMYYIVRDLPQVHQEVPAWGSWATLPLYFGSAVYAFEGIGLVLPLENNMKTPVSFGGKIGILNSGMMIVVCLYAAFGFFGYLQYGDTVMGSITLNLPQDEVLAQTVKLLMAIAVFMSYPLQMYVPISILAPWIKAKMASPRSKFIAEYCLRTGLVLFTFVLGAAIPNIGLFISLVGAVSSSALALIFPPILETVTYWPDTGKHNWRLIKGALICLFGLVGFAAGTVTSIQAIVESFKNPVVEVLTC